MPPIGAWPPRWERLSPAFLGSDLHDPRGISQLAGRSYMAKHSQNNSLAGVFCLVWQQLQALCPGSRNPREGGPGYAARRGGVFLQGKTLLKTGALAACCGVVVPRHGRQFPVCFALFAGGLPGAPVRCIYRYAAPLVWGAAGVCRSCWACCTTVAGRPSVQGIEEVAQAAGYPAPGVGAQPALLACMQRLLQVVA